MYWLEGKTQKSGVCAHISNSFHVWEGNALWPERHCTVEAHCMLGDNSEASGATWEFKSAKLAYAQVEKVARLI